MHLITFMISPKFDKLEAAFSYLKGGKQLFKYYPTNSALNKLVC